MKLLSVFCFVLVFAFPIFSFSQTDTSVKVLDSSIQVPPDTVEVVKTADTAVVAVPMNCYKQWLDYFTELGTKPMTDGMHPVVIAFKSKESCHCYMGKVEVVNGRIKAPLFVQNEGGEYNTFTALGKKLDEDFLAAQGDALWGITNGMSVLFQTTDQE